MSGTGKTKTRQNQDSQLFANRNVDVAFRTSTLALDDGKVVSGLVRREEGAQLVLVDSQGKEFRVPKDAIEERAEVRLSLMPENLVERMTEATGTTRTIGRARRFHRTLRGRNARSVPCRASSSGSTWS